LNLYTYCSNEPLLYVDPSGHSGLEIPVALGIFDIIYNIVVVVLIGESVISITEDKKHDNKSTNKVTTKEILKILLLHVPHQPNHQKLQPRIKME